MPAKTAEILLELIRAQLVRANPERTIADSQNHSK
jgi:hypothetical protein